MSQPPITVAMAVRNCERTVAAAIRSVVDQTFQDWTLLVINDGSTDRTVSEAERFKDSRIHVLNDSRGLGLPARLNQAIDLTQSEYFVRMDGDDICYPRRFELQLDFLRTHREVDLVGGGVCVFGREGRALGKRVPPGDHAIICRRPYAGFPMSHPAYFGTTDWFRTWKFEPAAGAICDQDLLLRSHARSTFANVPEIVLGYREDRLFIKKQFSYRVTFGRSLLANWKVCGVRKTAFGVGLVAAKLGVDFFSVFTGLQHRILSHRAKPATAAELAEWQRVWEAANQTHGTPPEN